jgi:tungstate transport system substrate-binding protein
MTLLAALAAGAALFGAATGSAAERYITLASTTSTQNSGLLDYLLPLFAKESGIEVRVVAVGTGQAMKLGERGDADVLLVHDTQAELEFVRQGYASERREVMHNDFIIVGPKSDPAGVAGMSDSAAALRKIAGIRAAFVSRADDSGTHRMELRLWKKAGVAAQAASGTWYKETGSGMGATLTTAAGLAAYTLTDRGTWAAFGHRGSLVMLVQGDPPLFNPYGVLPVNPKRHPHIKAAEAMRFVDWLTGAAGQQAIAEFKISGEQLFFPDAKVAAR